jgi:hypothetical protein
MQQTPWQDIGCSIAGALFKMSKADVMADKANSGDKR